MKSLARKSLGVLLLLLTVGSVTGCLHRGYGYGRGHGPGPGWHRGGWHHGWR